MNLKQFPIRYAAIALIVVLIALELNDAYGAPERLRNEKAATRQLRSIGAAQLAYQDTNLDKNYGSFHQLQRADFLPQAASYETLIPHYRIAVWSYYPTGINSWQGCGPDSSYTIIALPRRQGLRTFGMTDDLIPRLAPDAGVAIIETRPEAESQLRWGELRAAGRWVATPTCPTSWRPVPAEFVDPPLPLEERWQRWWHRFLISQ